MLLPLLFSLVASAVADCPSWCNAYTCDYFGDSCATCADCTALQAGTYCASWCNRYTQGAEHCSGCAAPTTAAWWCNAYTCGMEACELASVCMDQTCGTYCAGWCNPFTCGLESCDGCDACKENPRVPFSTSPRNDVSALPVCAPTAVALDTSGATLHNGGQGFSSATHLDGPKMMSAVDAIGYDSHQSLFKSNCGRPNIVTYAVGIGADVSMAAPGAGQVRVSSRQMNTGAIFPGGINSINGGLNYFFTQDGMNPDPNAPLTQLYSACNYNGALAYCTVPNSGYDYDYIGGGDEQTFCVAFKEGDYCDGTPTVEAYLWKVQNGKEHNLAGGAPDPFLGDPNKANKVCKTSSKMPVGNDPGACPGGRCLSFTPATDPNNPQPVAEPGCNRCTA